MSWGRKMRGRLKRGASALMAVLLLGAIAAAALLLWHEDAAEARRKAAARDEGRLLAMWLRVAHDATMIADYRPALAADPDGFELAPGALPGVPPGLPAPAGLTFGVMDDGAGVPMAWAVLTVEAFARGPARLGALDAGLAAVGIGGEAGGPMSAREADIGAARGAAVPAGSLFATADRGLAYQEEALYRREQPGRPWAARMDADLDLDGNDMVSGGAFEAREAATTGDVEAGCTPVAPATTCTGVNVAGRAEAARLNAGDLEAESLEGGSFRANGALAAGRLELSGAAGLRVRGGTPSSVTASGRVEAGSLRTVGRVDAALLVVGGALTGVTDLTATSGGIDGRELVVDNDLRSAGGAAVRVVGAGTLTAGSLSGGGSIAVAGDAFGPSATISGTLTVGTCNGCRPAGPPGP